MTVHDPSMDQLDHLLGAEDLAAYLDVPVTTLYAWRCRGEGPPGFRVGKHLRYRKTDVGEWIRFRLEEAQYASRGRTPTPSAGGVVLCGRRVARPSGGPHRTGGRLDRVNYRSVAEEGAPDTHASC